MGPRVETSGPVAAKSVPGATIGGLDSETKKETGLGYQIRDHS